MRKNLDPQVKMCFAKKLPQGRTDFYYKFHKKTTFLGYSA